MLCVFLLLYNILYAQPFSVCFILCSLVFNPAPVNGQPYQQVYVDFKPQSSNRTTTDPHHQQDHRSNPSLVWALSKSFGSSFIIAGVLKLITDVLAFASPHILK